MVNRIGSQMDQYLVASDFLKNIVENGNTLDDQTYSSLCSLLQDDAHVIEAFELAKSGTVSQVYPLEGNEEAIGLDMLTHPERKKEAQLAKETGQYTIAGPFELVQGGTGVLLFDPVYTKASDGNKQFWGFSLLVLNWDKFIEKLNLDSLETAGYHYQVWKHNMSTDEDVAITQCNDVNLEFALEVACDVPNDTWYVEISPHNGWISNLILWGYFFFASALAALVSFGYWQFEQQRYKDIVYAKKRLCFCPHCDRRHWNRNEPGLPLNCHSLLPQKNRSHLCIISRQRLKKQISKADVSFWQKTMI